MDLEATLEREQDIEELRRVALALHAQLQQTIRQLKRKCDQLAFYSGNKEELQQTLALIETLTAQSKAAERAAQAPPTKPSPPKARAKSGPTEQPNLPRVPMLFELDDADRTCPSCGGGLAPMADQFETSEMIDVVEVSYRVVEVKQQKYVCRCGGCVKRRPVPTARSPAAATRSRSRSRSCSTSTSTTSRSSARSGSSNATSSSSRPRRCGTWRWRSRNDSSSSTPRCTRT